MKEISKIVGTAKDGSDYTAVFSNLTFFQTAATSDNIMRCIYVNIMDDLVFEESENFTVTVTTTDPQVGIRNAMLTLTIIDNEGQHSSYNYS